MNETIQNRVGISGIGDDFVPTVDGELGSDDRRTAAVSLFEDFEEIMARGGVERLQPPIVEDQQIGATQRAKQSGMPAIAARQGEVLEEFGNAMIEHRAIVAAGAISR